VYIIEIRHLQGGGDSTYNTTLIIEKMMEGIIFTKSGR